jgi:hypothetical protein
MVAAGAVVGQAGAEVWVRRAWRGGTEDPGSARGCPVGGQKAAAAAALAVSGPLSFHTITPQRYLDTRFDGGGPFPPQGSVGEFFIFDFGDPDYFAGAGNEVPPGGQGARLQPHRHQRHLRREPGARSPATAT